MQQRENIGFSRNSERVIMGMQSSRMEADSNGSASFLQTSETQKASTLFIRLPKSGQQCPVTGLKRSQMNTLVWPCRANKFKPPVKSVCLRKPGAIKGTRLVHLASLLQYLHRFEEGGVE
jgi:hypothetical protein